MVEDVPNHCRRQNVTSQRIRVESQYSVKTPQRGDDGVEDLKIYVKQFREQHRLVQTRAVQNHAFLSGRRLHSCVFGMNIVFLSFRISSRF